MMRDDSLEETKAFWNRVADDWYIQVGDEGDNNRVLNSDPVLWKFAGDVSGVDVLDAGCGTGYLSKQLQEHGAKVVGIDFSENMIALAQRNAPKIDFRVDSCSSLETIEDGSIGLVVSNYVLMDTADLEGTMSAFYRVLMEDGLAVVIFSHPCFPQSRATVSIEENTVEYQWNQSYFEQRQNIDPPWGHFSSEFIWFHRPLSDYWKAFVKNGFEIVEFEEPRMSGELSPEGMKERTLFSNKHRPYSVAFRLRKR